jgi:hypothetical protein
MSSSSTIGSALERKVLDDPLARQPALGQPAARAAAVVDDQEVRQVGVGELGPGRGGRLADADGGGLPQVDVAHALEREPLEGPSDPTKSSTNLSAGYISSSEGGAYCARIPPSLRMAILSPILIASSMSWVTKTIVLRSSACRRRNSFWQALAVDRVDRAERLVHEHERRVGGEGAGDADALALAARELGGVAAGEVGRQADDPEEFLHRARWSGPCPSRADGGTVAMLSPIVLCGKRPIC